VTSGDDRRTRPNRKATLTIASVAAATVIAGAGIANGADGGVTAPAPPAIKDVRCVERCVDVRKVAETGLVELSGKDLGEVKRVRLKGAEGRVEAKVRRVRSKSVRFKVPRGARSGKPIVVDNFRSKVRSPVRLVVKPEEAIEEVAGFEVRRANATPSKSFYDGKKPSTVEYLFEAEGPTDIRIDVVKGKRQKLVDSFIKRNRKPFENHDATWDGLKENGRVAPNGKYRFQISQVSGGKSDRAKFRYYDHRFPLAGRHSYGDGLGAGRGHQGQDVFAKCGKPIYAARGGKVQVKASHSAAGNYVVIDGRKTGRDYVYMHLERRGRPKEGSKVRTGEIIGYNSDTGRATGCHLHFELWSAPGWYEGGKPLNPTKHLKRWDRWS
jgi:murein DD-endopeptidase MepM/ murein hydrolase activator NlpD